MAYTEYPIEHLDIRSLHLDVSNYRFAADQPSETAALNYLWTEAEVGEIAELILRDGYIDNEQPLVVSENGRFIVLEGNRRVSALMALSDPTLAPAHTAAIERLLKRFALEAENLPQSIRAMVLPDRAAAAPILARLHIGVSKRRWDLDEQAKFVIAQISDDVTIEQLSALLPGVENVPRVVRMGYIRDALKGTPFTDDALTRYVAGSRLKMSSFEYAYRQAPIQELIGLSFDSQSRVDSWASTPAQIAALERLLNGFKNSELNTRRGLKPGTAEFESLLEDMRGDHAPATENNLNNAANVDGDENKLHQRTLGDAPSPQSFPLETTVTSTAGTVTTSQTGEAPPGSPNASSNGEGSDADGEEVSRRGPNDPLLQVNISLTGIDELAQPVTIRRRLRELRRINVSEFPAAAAMLMRSVLEAAIKEHYGQSNGIDATGELGQVMRQVKADYHRNGQLANAINNVMRFGHDVTHIPGTGRWFNMVTHSANVDVNGRQVQQAWLVVAPLVRFLLMQPPRTQEP